MRVRNTALKIAKAENADLYIVELSALLHDIADHKFHGGDSTVGPKVARGWLESLKVEEKVVSHVVRIIENISFNKTLDGRALDISIEQKVVSDADKLDCLGDVGIARAFSYGGHKNRPFYDPSIKPMKYKNSEQYRKNSAGTTINHFYEKILLLKGTMNTKTGKSLAFKRHIFTEKFLKEFYSEWEGSL